MTDHQDMMGLISAAAEYQRQNPRHVVHVREWESGILAWLPGEAIRAQDRLIELHQQGHMLAEDITAEFGKALKTASEHFGVDAKLSDDVGCR